MHNHTRTLALSWVVIALAGCANVTGGGRAGQPDRWRTIVSANGATSPTETGPSNARVAAELGTPDTRDEAAGRISGRVVDEKGRPVPSASVRLADGSARSGRDIRDVTDPAGGFTLRGLRTGELYTLIAERDDGTTLLVGRAEAEAPESGLRIRLRDPETAQADPEVEDRQVSQKSRVGRASARESVPDEESADPFLAEQEEESPPPAPRASRPARVNMADLPPAEEAEALDLADDRTASRANRPIWRKGSGTSDPDVAAANAAPSERPVDTSPVVVPPSDPPPSAPPASDPQPATPPSPDRLSATPPATDPQPVSPPPAEPKPAPDEEEPNPLPPAKERPIEPLPSSTPPPVETLTPPSSPATEPTPPLDAVPAEPRTEPSPSPASPPADTPPPASPAEVKPGDPVGISAQMAPRRKPTWGEVMTQAAPAPAPAQVASTIPISTRRLPVKPASAPASRSSRVFGLLGGKGRDEPADGEAPAIPASSCDFDAKRQTVVDFRLPDLDGKLVSLRDFDADYVLLDFWGTWCKPCRESIPKLVEIQTRYGPKTLRVVGIASEAAGTSPESQVRLVDEVARSMGINYPLLMSSLDGKPCPLQQALHVQAYPTMILLDRKGVILWRGTGAEASTMIKLDRVIAARADSGVVRR